MRRWRQNAQYEDRAGRLRARILDYDEIYNIQLGVDALKHLKQREHLGEDVTNELIRWADTYLRVKGLQEI